MNILRFLCHVSFAVCSDHFFFWDFSISKRFEIKGLQNQWWTSLYLTNTILHGKCFVRYFRDRCFCIRNLTLSTPYARTFHEVSLSMHNLSSRRMEVGWGARWGHMQGRGGGANLPAAMVQFCAIISAPFHLRAHFWVPHLNFLALLGVRVSTDTLPGPNNKPAAPLTILSPPPLTFLWRAQVYREKSFKEGQYMCSVITWHSRN